MHGEMILYFLKAIPLDNKINTDDNEGAWCKWMPRVLFLFSRLAIEADGYQVAIFIILKIDGQWTTLMVLESP